LTGGRREGAIFKKEEKGQGIRLDHRREREKIIELSGLEYQPIEEARRYIIFKYRYNQQKSAHNLYLYENEALFDEKIDQNKDDDDDETTRRYGVVWKQ
jgi:hypothetical protein